MINGVVKFNVRHAISIFKNKSVPEYQKNQIVTGKVIGESPSEFFEPKPISLIEDENKTLFIVPNEDLYIEPKVKVKIWCPIKSKPNLKFKYDIEEERWIYKNDTFLIRIVPYFNSKSYVCDLLDNKGYLISSSGYQDSKSKAFVEMVCSLEKSKNYFNLINEM